jgi:GrpB-like predicted nucleotidyltransferase (UPF0157 family)
MLGLQKDSVKIVPHDPEWSRQFRQERQLLQQHIGQHVLVIEHVGSTAVPDLDAKPIIDIAIAVRSIEGIDRCRGSLLAIGYIDRGDAGSEGGYLFVREREPNVRTHHLHIVAIDDPQWAAYLAFRELLTENEHARFAYANLKHSLSQPFAADRRGYTKEKNDFIRQYREHAFRDGQT